MNLCCILWGHTYRFDTADIGAAHDCRRCGHHVPAIEWPRGGSSDAPYRKDDRGAYMPQGAGYHPDEPDITLADFIAERTALEQRIYDYIKAEASAFTKRTGATVSAIDVGMTEVTCIGEPAERMVSSVRVVTPLD